jgi:mannose-1-phosphate guanylyltransferase
MTVPSISLALPSDHVIKSQTTFTAAVVRASVIESNLVMFDIALLTTETGDGYIHTAATEESKTAAVQEFVEKNDRINAKQYIASSNY